jgi:hypothetical protein
MKDLQGRYQSLTPREREVMKRVINGLLNKQIAAQLGTTELSHCWSRLQSLGTLLPLLNSAHATPKRFCAGPTGS